MFKFGDMKGVETKEKMADWKSTSIIVQHLKIIRQSIMRLGICDVSVVRQGCLTALLAPYVFACEAVKLFSNPLKKTTTATIHLNKININPMFG